VANKVAILTFAALLLYGCVHSSRLERNVASGALLGGGTGMVIGGLARGTMSGALTGGVIGAVAGGLIGAAVTPAQPCYVRTASGGLRPAWCR
jgi:osmotically inducible lipoprotein OsmB